MNKMNTMLRALGLMVCTAALPALMSGCGVQVEEEPADIDDPAPLESDALASGEAPDVKSDTGGPAPGALPYNCAPDETACDAQCGSGWRNYCFVCCPSHLQCVSDCDSSPTCDCVSW